jgi:hypothetical protein
MQQVFICGWRNQAQEYRSCLMLQEGGQRLFERCLRLGNLKGVFNRTAKSRLVTLICRQWSCELKNKNKCGGGKKIEGEDVLVGGMDGARSKSRFELRVSFVPSLRKSRS